MISRLIASTISCAVMTVCWTPAAGTPGAPKPAPPRARALGTYQRAAAERLLAGRVASVDSLRICVFRVSFADRDFKAQNDSLYFSNELRHLAEYYDGASLGAFVLRWELMPGIVALSGREAYYGEAALWKERMAEILIQVVLERDAAVDFGRYDAVAVIHAGAGRETDFKGDSRYQLYSGFVNPDEMAEALEDTLGTPGVPTNDGAPGEVLYLDNLMVWPEESSQDGYVFGSLGIYAYQVALRLGMMPLFDTTPEDFPDSQGCGSFDLLGYGIYNALGFVPAFPSAFNRYLMGWAEPIVIEGDAAIRLADVSTAAPSDTGLVKIVVNPSEYFLVENRVHDTNFNGRFDFIDLNGNGVPENEDTLRGAEFDFFITADSNLRPRPDSIVTGSGLMIWHVDETAIRRALLAGGYPNDDRAFKGVDLEEADGIQDLDRPGGGYAFGSFYDSYREGNNARFAADTDPSSRTNSGAPSGIAIEEISHPGHYMSFLVRRSPGTAFTRGEFAANIERLPPITAPVGGSGSHDRIVMAADSGEIHVAAVGASAWAGEVQRIVRDPGLHWITPPVTAALGAAMPEGIFIVSRGGVLRAYDWMGVPLAIDNDASPTELQLRGDSKAALIAVEADGDNWRELMALSSTQDSTYLLVLGYEGPAPAGGWKPKGIGGIETVLAGGRLAALPALGYRYENSQDRQGGLFFATFAEDAGLRFHWAPLWTTLGLGFETGSLVSAAAGVRHVPADPVAVCAGDIDGNRRDEMAAAIPGYGLYYFDTEGALRRRGLRGSRPSPPIFSDVDGDGTLETALRDESHMYLFSGFGVPVTGWPIGIDPGLVEAYRSVAPIPPVAGDIDGDGRVEVLFRVGGSLHAIGFSGKELPGWPLPGEGPSGGSLALLRSDFNQLYIADCASVAPVAGGGASRPAVSSIRRYEPARTYSDRQIWPSYRHDSWGTSHQDIAAGSDISGVAVDAATFIIYPNPARRASFTARVIVSRPARVTVTIFNLEGQKVVSRERRHDWPSGSNVPFEEAFRTADFASGIYLCRIEAAGDGWSWSDSRKFAIVR